jgi:hypothetical protein
MWIRPVHAVEVDESAEVDDVRDLALDDVARGKPVENRLAHLLALVLEDGATGEHHVVPRAVELDHLAAELLAEELVEILDAADVHERRGQEAADAEVEDQAALDHLDHLAGHRLAALGRGLDRLPGHLEPRALLGEDEAAFRVLLRQDERVDLVSEVDLVGRVDRAPDRELRDRDDALRLVADVHEDLVLVYADNSPVDDLALVDRRKGRVVVGNPLAVGASGPDAGFARIDCVVGHQKRVSIATTRKTSRLPALFSWGTIPYSIAGPSPGSRVWVSDDGGYEFPLSPISTRGSPE